jgi:C-terminal processing protease CtpA/Prc
MRLASPESMRDPVAALGSRWGLILEPTGNWPEVKVVKNGSSPLGSEIVAGDLLVSAWGQSLAFVPMAQVAQALLGPSGSTVKLTIQRPLHLPKGSSPGMTFEMEPLGLTVTKVEPGGASESTGVRVGDRIVALHGDSTRYLPLAEARRAFQKAREEGMTIVIHRDLMVKRK